MDCSTFGLYCITITWQQIFKGSFQVAAIGILPPATVKPRLLGKYCSETVAAGSSKPNRVRVLGYMAKAIR